MDAQSQGSANEPVPALLIRRLPPDPQIPPARTGRQFRPVIGRYPSHSQKPERDHTMPFTLLSDDELIARLLIHTWTLATGKTLRCDVPPHELTKDELIDFWADENFD
jgi:hypothetical protein